MQMSKIENYLEMITLHILVYISPHVFSPVVNIFLCWSFQIGLQPHQLKPDVPVSQFLKKSPFYLVC